MPLKFVLKQLLIVSPFVAVMAVSSIFYDRTAAAIAFGPFQLSVSVGFLRCLAICGKFLITMSVLIGLVATTRFADLLAAMAKLGVPKILVMQLGLLYRYIFLITDRAGHILRARAGRKLRNLGLKTELKTAAAMVGTLCLGSLDTAVRVNAAMQARGFNGDMQTLLRTKLTTADYLFAAALILYLLAVKLLMRGF